MSLIDNVLDLPVGERLKLKTENLKIFIEIKKEDFGFTWEVINLLNITSPPIFPKYPNKEDKLFFKTEKAAKRNLIRTFMDDNFTFGKIELGTKFCKDCGKEKELKYFHKNSDTCRVCYYKLRSEIAQLEEDGKSKCIECGKTSEFKNFRKNKSTSSVGVSPVCLECVNKKQREWKEKRNEKN